MKSDTSLEHGDLVKDTITGFQGVVIGRTDWLNGCVRMVVQPKELKDGKPIDALTFDVEQLELVAPKVAPNGSRSGGEMPGAVRR
jgi:hypothetical protein